MKVDTLLVSAFLAGTADCFAPPSFAAREFVRRASASFQNEATPAARSSIPQRPAQQTPRRSRKRPRTRATPMTNTDDAAADAAAAATGAASGAESLAPLILPRRLQETVDRLGREVDLISKSKLLVELGDAFARTDAAVLPGDNGAWPPQKVPGCVSEVHVAVAVAVAQNPGSEGTTLGDGNAVSIRGTADARLSRGILAMLACGLEGESPDTVLNLRGKALAKALGLRAGLTDSRINGLGNVLAVIQGQVRDQLDYAAGGCGRGVEPPPDAAAAAATSAPMTGGGLDHGRSWGLDASRWFPLPGAEDEVAMLLSGGVDSSVAMRLLQEAGYRIRAFYLKIWLEDELSHLGECPWEEDLAYAEAVCEQAGVPLEVVPLQHEYWEQVVSYTVREAREGRTPNPDVMCNSRIKFGMFYDHVGKHFRHVASGHYARLEHNNVSTAGVVSAVSGGRGDLKHDLKPTEGHADGPAHGRVRLLLSPDAVKDQTYFLCALNQAQLRKALFPIGEYTKEHVRELAESYNLPTKNRKDSQGICFLGKLKFDDFLRHYLGEAPGTIVERETGRAIGEHRGLWFHTIGQRKGVGPGLIPGYVNLGPWYVSGKDMAANVLEVTNDRDAIDGPRMSFQVEALRWIADRPPGELEREGVMSLQVKTRHGPQMKNCVLRLTAEAQPSSLGDFDKPTAYREVGPASEGGGEERAGAKGAGAPVATLTSRTSTRGFVLLDTKDSGLAPGQFAAFYLGEECMGAGVISDSSGVYELPGDSLAASDSTDIAGRGSVESAAGPALQQSAVVA